MLMRNTTIGQRLAAGFGAVLLLLSAVVAVDGYGRQRQAEVETQLTSLVMPRADAANDIETAYLREAAAAQSYVYSGDEAYLADYRRNVQQSGDAVARLNGLPENREGKALFDQIAPLATQYTLAADKAIALRQQGDVAGAQQVVQQEMQPARRQLLDKTVAFVALQVSLRDAAVSELEGVRTTTTVASLILALLALAVGVVISWATALSVRNPALELLLATKSLGRGDFDDGVSLALRARGRPESVRDEIHQLAGAVASMGSMLIRRDRRLEARARLSSVLASTLEAQRLATEGLREIARYAETELGLVYAYDREADLLRRLAAYSIESASETLRPGEGIVGEAAASRRTVVVSEIPADAPFTVKFGFDQLPPRAVMAVPVISQDELVGVLVLGTLREMTKESVDFAEISARQLAVSLQNAFSHTRMVEMAEALREKNEQLAAQNEELQAQNAEIQAQDEEIQSQSEEIQAQNEELQSQNEEIRAQSEELDGQNRELGIRNERITRLQRLTADLSRYLSPEEVLEEIAEAASALLNSTLASVLLLDPSRSFLTVAAASGLDETEQASLRLSVAESLAGRAIADGHSLFIGDLAREPGLRVPVLAGGAKVGALVVAPMVAAGEALGVVEVYFDTPRDFSPEDVELFSTLAAAGAMAIHNARLFSATSRQRQLLQGVVDSIPEAVQVVDARGRLVIANSAARELFDFGQLPSLAELVAGGEAPDGSSDLGVWGPTVRAWRGETVLAEEASYLNPRTGRPGYLQVSAAPVFVPEEEGVAAAVTVAADVSRLKEIDHLKDEFISEAAHELKTPITALKGFAQLLRRRMEAAPGTEGYQKLAQTIDGQTDRLVRLVDRLLDASRLQAGRLTMKPESVDLASLARQQAQMAQIKTSNHQILVEASREVTGQWDRGYLEQVVANLLENSIQYSPQGGDVRVVVTREDGLARLTVADQGIGMSRETIAGLFRRHFRSNEARQVRAEGLGLGLYLSHEIVARHGGRLWAESQPGKGSVFTVELPLMAPSLEG